MAYSNTFDEERNGILNKKTDNYLTQHSQISHPEPGDAYMELLMEVNNEIRGYNSCLGKYETKYRLYDNLPNDVVAQMMAKFYYIKKILVYGETEKDDNWMLGIYNDDGVKKGLYETSPDAFYKLSRKFNRRISMHDSDEIMKVLSTIVPVVERCSNIDFIPLNNGIFNYKTKELMNFDESFVFLSKSSINFNPQAKNVVIANPDGTSWDIESWIYDLCESKYPEDDMGNFLWQIIGSILRPNVPFNKAIMAYSSCGCSGKGTFATLLRNMAGTDNCASIKLENFDKRFALSQLLSGATAIITDENSVGSYLESAANFKDCVTMDPLDIEVKYRNTVRYLFKGRIFMCMNDIVRSRDTSGSFYRRLCWLEFNHNFIDEGERKYIKTDYLNRQDVLEYCLYKTLVLMDDFYEYNIPQVCIDNMEAVKEINEPIQVYWEIYRDKISYNVAPWGFLYDLYLEYMRRDNPNGKSVSKIAFKRKLLEYIEKDTDWCWEGDDKRYRPEGRYDFSEPLIAEFDLIDWKNRTYNGPDIDIICTAPHKVNQQGIIKRAFLINASEED